MTTLSTRDAVSYHQPIDLVEQFIIEKNWGYDRPTEEDVIAEFSSQWSNFRLWFRWEEQLSALMFTCTLEGKCPPAARKNLASLICMINERLWLGHFDICSEEGVIAFRHTLLLKGESSLTIEQLEELVEIALLECERAYPALQSVNWAGKSPEEALKTAIFETVGEA